MFIVYKITNKVNGKVYIGFSSFSVEKRFKEHCEGKKSYFQRSISKHGPDNFTREVIFQTEDKIEALEKEVFYIAQHNSTNREFGYNSHPGGLGGNLSDEAKQKISIKSRGRISKPISEETRRRISEAQKGKKASEEARRNMSKAQKGKKISEEQKKKLSIARKGKFTGEANPFYGKKHTEETRKKIASREYKKGAEHHQRWINCGRQFTEENHPRARSVSINGVKYFSRNDACRKLGVSRKILTRQISLFGNQLSIKDLTWGKFITLPGDDQN